MPQLPQFWHQCTPASASTDLAVYAPSMAVSVVRLTQRIVLPAIPNNRWPQAQISGPPLLAAMKVLNRAAAFPGGLFLRALGSQSL